QGPPPYAFEALVVRSSLDPHAFEKSLRDQIATIDRDQAVTQVKALEQLKTELLGSARLRSELFSVFALVAVLLASIGMYGVVTQVVTARRYELAVRAALGATSSTLIRSLLRDLLSLVLLGV